MKYNSFISYSHSNKELPEAIQSGLRSLANSLFKLEALRVFRDVTNLSASPELWPDIESALKDSEFFILLASPEAAKSKWVDKEVEYWIQHKPKGTLLLALVKGEIAWDPAKRDFDWEKTNALPISLRGVFSNEPNYANFLYFTNPKDSTLDNIEFRQEIAKLAARLHHTTVGELIGLQERAYRRKIRLRNTTIFILCALLLATGCLAILFKRQRNQIQQELAANQLGVVALEQERIDPTASVAKLLEAFKISGDSSLYSLAITVGNRNYLYDHKTSLQGMRVMEVNNGSYLSVTSENKYIVITARDTLRGNLQELVGKNEIDKVELNAAADFFLLKLRGSGIIHVVGTRHQQTLFLEGVDAIFDQNNDDIICLTSKGEIRRYLYTGQYKGVEQLSKIKEDRLLQELDTSKHITIKLNAGSSMMAINHRRLSMVSLQTGEERMSLEKYEAAYNTFAISTSGKYLAIDSGFQIVIFKNGKRDKVLKGHRNYISSLDFSPLSDDLLISTSLDMTGTIYNVDADQRMALLGHLATPLARFSKEGTSFITYDTSNIIVWPLVGFPQRVLAESDAGFNTVKMSPGNKYISAADMDGRLWLWALDGTILFDSVIISNQFMKEKIAFDKKEEILYIISSEKNSVLAYSIKEKKWTEKYTSSSQVITAIVITESNDLIAFSTTGKVLFPGRAGPELAIASIREKDMNIMSVTNKDGLLYVSNDEGQVLVLSKWGKVVDTIEFGDNYINVQSVAISETKTYVAVTGNSGNIKLYKEKYHLIRTLPVRADYNMDVKFLHLSNDFVSTSDDQKVRRWNIEGREIAAYGTGAMSIIYALDVSADDQYMMTADDRKVLLWRMKKPMLEFSQ